VAAATAATLFNLMKRACFFGILYWISAWAMAQTNLVPNPSFEEYYNCPESGINMDTLGKKTVKYWFTPIATTPDYFNPCAKPTSNKGVPLNGVGYQPARTGNAYCGIVSIFSDAPQWREYIAIQLSQSLKSSSIYKIDYYLSLAFARNNVGIKSTSKFGCLFTKNISYLDTNIYPIKPNVETDSLFFFDDTLNWMKVSFYYQAKGNENYLTIGNFNDDAHTPTKLVLPNRPTATRAQSYYYIDDVSVVEYSNTQNTLTDTTLCTLDTIRWGMRPDFDSCIWNDGSNLASRVLKQPGKYWVTSYYNNWLSYTDTLIIRLFDTQYSRTDAFFCANEKLTLQAKPAPKYLWNTADTTSFIAVANPNTYWVKRMATTCFVTDSFFVTEKPLPVILSLKDTTVCFDEVAQILLDAGTFKSYLWKPTGETTQTIYSNAAQVYLLSVTDTNNCSTHKQVAVMETCPEFVYLPNAFTPNADGLNDVFLPNTRNLTTYEFTIINRWGAILFTTQNPQQGWDGKDAQADVYIAQVRYTAGKATKLVKQTITLLR
jgi:gliding motility-associated-like protein